MKEVHIGLSGLANREEHRRKKVRHGSRHVDLNATQDNQFPIAIAKVRVHDAVQKVPASWTDPPTTDKTARKKGVQIQTDSKT